MRPVSTPVVARSCRDRRGFTLLEILIVLAILGLLVGVLMTSINSGFFAAKEGVARLFVSTTVKVPLQVYSLHMGNYPSTEEGLKALVNAPAAKAERWKGPYLDDGKLPIDPWGETYLYRSPGVRNKTTYDIWSKGPDRQDGTADDIGNWSTEGTK
ncbi:MAG: type II secretion system major pseudopilin GspG [Opitutaceae bacterium]|nr:type II secretion system major pseudopilin GspG [Opitutaceae bacterium]